MNKQERNSISMGIRGQLSTFNAYVNIGSFHQAKEALDKIDDFLHRLRIELKEKQ